MFGWEKERAWARLNGGYVGLACCRDRVGAHSRLVVQTQIRFLRPSLSVDNRPRRLRLIQLGRLLTDGTYLVPWTVQLLSRRAKLVREQTQPNSEAFFEGAMEGLEAVGREIGVTVRGGGGGGDDKMNKEKAEDQRDVKGKGKEKEKSLAGTEAEEDKRVWLHCSVGEPMEDEEIEGEKVQVCSLVRFARGVQLTTLRLCRLLKSLRCKASTDYEMLDFQKTKFRRCAPSFVGMLAPHPSTAARF
jgi:hypothetical protein